MTKESGEPPSGLAVKITPAVTPAAAPQETADKMTDRGGGIRSRSARIYMAPM
jgi:hypothetical protein